MVLAALTNAFSRLSTSSSSAAASATPPAAYEPQAWLTINTVLQPTFYKRLVTYPILQQFPLPVIDLIASFAIDNARSLEVLETCKDKHFIFAQPISLDMQGIGINSSLLNKIVRQLPGLAQINLSFCRELENIQPLFTLVHLRYANLSGSKATNTRETISQEIANLVSKKRVRVILGEESPRHPGFLGQAMIQAANNSEKVGCIDWQDPLIAAAIDTRSWSQIDLVHVRERARTDRNAATVLAKMLASLPLPCKRSIL